LQKVTLNSNMALVSSQCIVFTCFSWLVGKKVIELVGNNVI
jgi:hypothetical protein